MGLGAPTQNQKLQDAATPQDSSSPINTSVDMSDVLHKEAKVEFTQLCDIPPAGRFYTFFGESKCGKTIGAISMGYLNMKYIPELKEAGFKYIPYALENGILPSIDKIILIDSESFLKQAGWPLERKIIGDILKSKVIHHVQIGTPTKREVMLQEKVVVDRDSISKVQLAVDSYVTAIEMAIAESTPNTLIIVDSGSRLKWLLDSYADILYTAKISSGQLKDNPATKMMDKYQPRNAEWVRIMGALKQSPANVILTLMMTDTPQQLIEMALDARAKGNMKFKIPPQKKKEWVEKGAEYNFDFGIFFDEEDEPGKEKRKYSLLTELRSVVDKSPEKIYIDKGNKFSFLRNIEYMLEQEIGNDIDG